MDIHTDASVFSHSDFRTGASDGQM